jgi:flagellar biosynthetic protein FliP
MDAADGNGRIAMFKLPTRVGKSLGGLPALVVGKLGLSKKHSSKSRQTPDCRPENNPVFSRKMMAYMAIGLVFLSFIGPSMAQESASGPLSMKLPDSLAAGPKAWASPEGLTSTIQVMLLLTVLSLAPAILLMTTCFVRIIVVLSLLRQAIGTQQLPPSQVITTLALFLTFLIMAPVWKQVYNDAIVPYTEHRMTMDEAIEAGTEPVRRFMSQQIERTKNTDDIFLFMNYIPDQKTPETYEDVPLTALLPAFVLSELKTAFLIGFQIYLPFLILDMVVASVMVSMGMMMLPPVMISLPFKILLFVLLDGWHLVVGMLMDSFQPFT